MVPNRYAIASPTLVTDAVPLVVPEPPDVEPPDFEPPEVVPEELPESLAEPELPELEPEEEPESIKPEPEFDEPDDEPELLEADESLELLEPFEPLDDSPESSMLPPSRGAVDSLDALEPAPARALVVPPFCAFAKAAGASRPNL